MFRYRIPGSLLMAAALMASVAGCGRSSRAKNTDGVPPMPDQSKVKSIRSNAPPPPPKSARG